jgi:hypothetical protein
MNDQSLTTVIGGLLIRHAVTFIAGALVAAGAVQPSLESQFITIGVGIATWAFGVALSWWQKQGQVRLQVRLAAELARIRMSAQQRQGAAAPAQPAAATRTPPAAAVVLLALGLGALLACGGTARAQAKKVLPLPDPLHLVTPASAPGAPAPLAAVDFTQVSQQIQKIAKEAVDKGIQDLSAAATDAQNRADKIAKPCWDAQVAFLQLLPVEWATPPAEVGPALTIQIGRDLGNAINGNADGSLKVACAALLGDTLSIVNNVMAVVGLKAGLAAVGIP